MATPFELVIQKMIDLGFYNFVFPFILTAAIVYALLRRSKFLGESVATNALVALTVAFLVLGFPVIVGFSFAVPLSTFFTQATIWVLILVIGVLMASIFYPDLMKILGETFTKRTTIYEMLALAVALFVTSGLVGVFTQPISAPGKIGALTAPRDVIIIIAGIVIFIVLILIAASIFRGGGIT